MTTHEENELRQLQIILDEINSILEKKYDSYDPFTNKDALSIETVNELLQENTLLEQSLSTLKSEHADVVDSFKKIRKTQEKYQKLYYNTFRKYHDLYEHSPVMYRSIDPFGKIVNCNLTYCKALGYTKKEVIGSHIFEHVSDSSKDKMEKIFEKWRKDGIVEQSKIWLKRKDGTVFPGILQARTIFSEDGSILGSNTAIQDFTQVHNLTEKLQETNIRLKEELKLTETLNRVKDEFMTMITHELKTPLVPIKGYSDMLIDEKFGSMSAENKNRLKIIQKNADSLLALVTNLLDAQKMELGEFKIDPKPLDFSILVNDFVNKTMPLFSNQISFEKIIDSGIFCNCDKQRIEQVLSNIIENAADFCPKQNGIIKISLEKKTDTALLRISDNGIGLTDKRKNEIFQKFYQTDRSLTRNHGGTGLGLSICKGIVESHDGKIWAESEGKGKGTTICIELPLQTSTRS